MNPTGNRLRNHRVTFALAVCAALVLASALPLTVASCRSQTAPADDTAAYERLRLLTRGGVLPAEPQLAQLADAHKGTRTGSLAQLATVSGSAEASSTEVQSARAKVVEVFRSLVVVGVMVPRLMTR